LLAAGYFGFGSVSCFLAAYSTVQITWYSAGRVFWFTKKRYHDARQIVTAVAPGTSKISPMTQVSTKATWLQYGTSIANTHSHAAKLAPMQPFLYSSTDGVGPLCVYQFHDFYCYHFRLPGLHYMGWIANNDSNFFIILFFYAFSIFFRKGTKHTYLFAQVTKTHII
jgi:hypothetical protein